MLGSSLIHKLMNKPMLGRSLIHKLMNKPMLGSSLKISRIKQPPGLGFWFKECPVSGFEKIGSR
jgi:hypothetical protein